LFLLITIAFSSSLDAVLQRVVEMDRSDIDFTDRAWNVLASKYLNRIGENNSGLRGPTTTRPLLIHI